MFIIWGRVVTKLMFIRRGGVGKDVYYGGKGGQMTRHILFHNN